MEKFCFVYPNDKKKRCCNGSELTVKDDSVDIQIRQCFTPFEYSEQTPDQEEGALFLQLPASATDLHFFSLQ